MKKAQVHEVREELAKYITEAEQGEEIIITKHKKPVARLVAYEEEKPAFPDMKEFREQFVMKGKPLSNTVVEMRNEERF
jgi:prevent-host-death family protein